MRRDAVASGKRYDAACRPRSAALKGRAGRAARGVEDLDRGPGYARRPSPGGSAPPDAMTRLSLGRVEEGRGGLYRIGITPFPFPAHQTGRANFPHPAFRLASSRGTRRGAKMNPAQPKHAEIPEHGPSREPRGAARRHLVTPDQKMPNALIDVIVDRSIGRQARPVPSPATGLPRLPVSPSLRAVPTTPADRKRVHSSVTPPFHAAFP